MEPNKPTIMVVDDNEEFTALYAGVLTVAGYNAVTENDSTKALDLAHSVKPDIFVIDLMMPPPDGFQLCRQLRAELDFRITPIIIVTALNDEDSRIVAFGAGANDYLTKPFSTDDLKVRIEFHLGRSNSIK